MPANKVEDLSDEANEEIEQRWRGAVLTKSGKMNPFSSFSMARAKYIAWAIENDIPQGEVLANISMHPRLVDDIKTSFDKKV